MSYDPPDLHDQSPGSRTPPTPPVDRSQSPPASPLPRRLRAVAQLRPVSIADVVRVVRHYMPDGVPEPEASVHGNVDEHCSSLKRKADGISRSLSEVFAYLTYNTSSLNEAKKLLTIITNVSLNMHCIISIILNVLY